MIERLRDSSDPKFDAVDLFEVNVKDAQIFKDYLVSHKKLLDDPSKKTVLYEFTFNKQNKLNNYTIIFSLKTDHGLYDNNRNQLKQ